VIVVDVEQRSPEWLALRRGAITASAADRLLTQAKIREYALELAAERLVREVPPNIVTAAMQWGIDHEENARLRYAFERGVDVLSVGFAWLDDLEGWIGCSPDGVVGDDGLVEVKCPSSKRHLEYLTNGEAPKEYMAQIQFQLWVTGRQWCDFVSYDPRFERGDFFCRRVERDEAAILALGSGAAECIDQIRRHVAAAEKA
jgi:putative phage-type endonuclease